MKLHSFDLFDTLITRATRNPRDIFMLVGASKHIKYRLSIFSAIPFQTWRRLAEKIARKASQKDDIAIFDIYRILGLIIHSPSKILKIEISVEKELTQPIHENLAQITKHHLAGDQVCVISDMYLPTHILKQLTSDHIPSSIPIYCSSKYGTTKSSGKLYSIVSENEGIPFNGINHTGDNPNADFHAARQLGITARLITAPSAPPSNNSLDCLKSPRKNVFFEIGLKLAGPGAFYMAQQINRHLKADNKNAKKILFGSRDTYLIKYAYEKYNTQIPAHYVRVSRGAIYKAYWYKTRDHSYWFEGVSNGLEFFERLGLRCPENLLKTPPHSRPNQFITALESPEFIQSCAIEYETVRKYLTTEGFDERTIYVDLGWKGSIQKSIESILDIQGEIHGIYFGTTQKIGSGTGVFFREKRPRKRFFLIFQSISFFEYIFTEPHQTLGRIAIDNGIIKQEFLRDESETQIAHRREVELGAKHFIDQYSKLEKIINFSPNKIEKSLEKLYSNYLKNPPIEWIAALQKLTHSSGFSGSGITPMTGSEKLSLLSFLKSPWRGGYIAQHANMPPTFFLKMLNNTPAFIAYDLLKSLVRHVRKLQSKIH